MPEGRLIFIAAKDGQILRRALEGVIYLFKKLTVEEQVRINRQEGLAQQNEQKRAEELLLEHLVDLDFRQSLIELGV